jgi:hypothetical protein
MNADHKCRKCRKGEPEVQFYTRTTKSGRYKRHLCKKCYNAYRKQFPNRSNGRCQASYRAKIAEWRRLNQYTERWILQDSRRTDRKNGLENDLNETFIKTLIEDGCRYCGETKIRMTLDRVNNAVGHLKENVVPACVRCNSIRMNMPYAAWLVVVKAIKQARLAGLFGSWTGKRFGLAGVAPTISCPPNKRVDCFATARFHRKSTRRP